MGTNIIRVLNFEMYCYLDDRKALPEDVEYEFDIDKLFEIVEFGLDINLISKAIEILEKKQGDDVTELFIRSIKDTHGLYRQRYGDYVLKRAECRAMIVVALGKRPGDKVVVAIYQAMVNEFHRVVRVAAAKALINREDTESIETFFMGMGSIIKTYHDYEIIIIFCTLCENGRGEYFQEQLFEIVRNYRDYNVKIASVRALMTINSDEVLAMLLKVIESNIRDDELVKVLLGYICNKRPEESRAIFKILCGSDEEDLRLKGKLGLYALGDQQAIREIREILDKNESDICIYVAEVLLGIDHDIAFKYFEDYFVAVMDSEDQLIICRILSQVSSMRIMKFMMEIVIMQTYKKVRDVAFDYLVMHGNIGSVREIISQEPL